MRTFFVSLILLSLTGLIFIQHLGTASKLTISENESKGVPGVFIEKTKTSHRHVILQGSDYHRGAEYGRLLQAELLKIEDLMVSKLDHFIGSKILQNAFFSFAMIWFHDVDQYIDEGSLKEMQGVSVWAPKKFDNLADGFTRQIAYHGLHEVGQMFVDEDRVDMGCFASMVETPDHKWVIGRNFDFDVDGHFDREKTLKWVFPDDGHAYLSVTWGGMVGVVTGINDEGIYASINAAGSDDFNRVGTPTTIVLKNILQQAHNLDEAIKILQTSQTFITDIFLIADRKKNQIAIVEKSPKKMTVRFVTESSVVANHLTNKMWTDDRNNMKRRGELTSESRYLRGLELIQNKTFSNPLAKTVEILRDQKLPGNKSSYLGNRGAIDSLIASQSVIFDLAQNNFYVNLGPGTHGQYLGYDLTASFGQKKPVIAEVLGTDDLTQEQYDLYQQRVLILADAKIDLQNKKCDEVAKKLNQVVAESFVHSDKERLIGDYAEKCMQDMPLAKTHWQRSLSLNPPYAKQRKYLEEKLK